MWPDNRILDLFRIQSPIIQAPMAGSVFSEMVIAVSEAGALGSLACALLSVEQARTELETIRRQTSRPINVNFFWHQPPGVDPAREMARRQRLYAYFVELAVDKNTVIPSANRAPFDDKMCDLVGRDCYLWLCRSDRRGRLVWSPTSLVARNGAGCTRSRSVRSLLRGNEYLGRLPADGLPDTQCGYSTTERHTMTGRKD